MRTSDIQYSLDPSFVADTETWVSSSPDANQGCSIGFPDAWPKCQGDVLQVWIIAVFWFKWFTESVQVLWV